MPSAECDRFVLWSILESSTRTWASSRGVELLDSEQLVAQAALHDSPNAFCHGAPGPRRVGASRAGEIDLQETDISPCT